MKRPRRLQGGDIIRASDWNALVDGINKVPWAPFGMGDGSNRAQPRVGQSTLVVSSTHSGGIPPWSVFGITSYPDNEVQPVKLSARRIGPGDPASQFGMFTNGPSELADGGTCHAHMVNGYFPCRIEVTGDDPVPGWPCGVEPGTFGVGHGQYGLLCVALEDDGSGTKYAWCVRAFDAAAMVGEVTEQITSRDGDTPGSGTVAMQVLSGGDLVDAIDPSDSMGSDDTMEFPVLSLSDEAIDVSAFVLASVVVGVGLIAVKLAEGSSGGCFIPNVAYDDLVFSEMPDAILGVEDGCLVLVAVGVCDEGSSS